MGQYAETEWEQFGTEANAVKAKEDITQIATLLYEKAEVKHEGPLGPFSFWISNSLGTYSESYFLKSPAKPTKRPSTSRQTIAQLTVSWLWQQGHLTQAVHEYGAALVPTNI